MIQSTLKASVGVQALHEDEVCTESFRNTLGQFATGVTVVTTLDSNGNPYGITVSSFASLSLDPPLVQWSLRRDAYSYRVFREARCFAVNILAAGQEDLARRFCASIDRFHQLRIEEGLFGLPLLPDALASIECERFGEHPGGDHAIFIGRVIRARHHAKSALLYWQGRYHSLPQQDGSGSQHRSER
jgi:flavin reductase (DIM6/NTAB) family NADH-FMN oxidoreductase RutF